MNEAKSEQEKYFKQKRKKELSLTFLVLEQSSVALILGNYSRFQTLQTYGTYQTLRNHKNIFFLARKILFVENEIINLVPLLPGI